MKKYLTKRNIFVVAFALLFISAMLVGFLKVQDTSTVLIYSTMKKEFSYGFIGIPHGMVCDIYVVVYRAVLFAVFLLGAVVFAVLFLVEIRKGKPSNKQRIAELEKQIAELKQNQKD